MSAEMSSRTAPTSSPAGSRRLTGPFCPGSSWKTSGTRAADPHVDRRIDGHRWIPSRILAAGMTRQIRGGLARPDPTGRGDPLTPAETQDGRLHASSPHCSACRSTSAPICRRRRWPRRPACRPRTFMRCSGGRPARRSSSTPCACAGTGRLPTVDRTHQRGNHRVRPRIRIPRDVHPCIPPITPPMRRRTSPPGPATLDRARWRSHDRAHPALTRVSTTSAILLQPAHVAFVRRIGPYDVDPDEYATCWTGSAAGARLDRPDRHRSRRTRHHTGARLRSMSCPGHPTVRSIAKSATRLPERWCAATSYVGPFSGLAAATRRLRGASGLRGFDVLGLPAEERYLTNALLTHQKIQTTQILIPLRRTRPD